MAERKDTFWTQSVIKLRPLELEWQEEVKKTSKIDYSMEGELDGKIEQNIGNRVVLAGPLVDDKLLEIAKAMKAKLTRGRLTGLAPPMNIKVPWQIMKFIVSMATSYGVQFKVINHPSKTKRQQQIMERIVMFIEEGTSEKLFNPARFDGTNYLANRFFKNLSIRKRRNVNCNIVVKRGLLSQNILRYNLITFLSHQPFV